MSQKIPTLLLEKAVLGELTKNELSALAKRCGEESELQTMLADLKQSNQDLLQKYPVENFQEQIEIKTEAKKRIEKLKQTGDSQKSIHYSGWKTWGTAVTTLFLFAVLGPWQVSNHSSVGCEKKEYFSPHLQSDPVENAKVRISQNIGNQKAKENSSVNSEFATSPIQEIKPSKLTVSSNSNQEDGIRLKGTAEALVVFRRDEEGDYQLKSKAKVKPGSLLQIHIRLAQDKHVLAFSIDSKGSVTWLYPEKGVKSSIVSSGIKALPHSFELDSTQGMENFYLLTSDSSFESKSIAKSIGLAITQLNTSRGLDSLPELPSQISQSLFQIEKPKEKANSGKGKAQ